MRPFPELNPLLPPFKMCSLLTFDDIKDDKNNLISDQNLSNFLTRIIQHSFRFPNYGDIAYIHFVYNGYSNVIISSEEPGMCELQQDPKFNQLQSKLNDDNINDEEKDKLKDELLKLKLAVLILGSYTSSNKIITLYIKNIKKCINTDDEYRYLISATFIHEMAHAYFDRENQTVNAIPYIEEPLAEFGTLMFIHDFDKTGSNNFFHFINKIIGLKKYCSPICYYGFGEYLLNLWLDNEYSGNIANLVFNYKTGMGNNNESKKIFEHGYPSNEYSYFEKLSNWIK